MLILLLAFGFWIAINGRLSLYGYLATYGHAALVKSVQGSSSPGAGPVATPTTPTTPATGFNDPGMSQFSEAGGGTSGATADNVNPTSPGWAQFLQKWGLMGGASP